MIFSIRMSLWLCRWFLLKFFSLHKLFNFGTWSFHRIYLEALSSLSLKSLIIKFKPRLENYLSTICMISSLENAYLFHYIWIYLSRFSEIKAYNSFSMKEKLPWKFFMFGWMKHNVIRWIVVFHLYMRNFRDWMVVVRFIGRNKLVLSTLDEVGKISRVFVQSMNKKCH